MSKKVYEWSKWNGGQQPPVACDTHVYIRNRTGFEYWTKRPQWLAWTHSRDGADPMDIVAFRVVKEQS